MKTIKRFLIQSKKYLKENGTIFLGVNCFFCSTNKIEELIKKSNYNIKDIRINFFKFYVFILEN